MYSLTSFKSIQQAILIHQTELENIMLDGAQFTHFLTPFIAQCDIVNPISKIVDIKTDTKLLIVVV